jgi:H+/Cl- antiporter ClcA
VSTPAPPGPPSPPDPDKPPDPLALLRSRSYIVLLVIAVIIGAPVSAAAYFFLALVSKLQGWVFTDLPKGVGFHAEPLWWPILPLLVAGVLVALTIKYLPGTGGHSPADGFKAGAGPPSPRDLPGIVLAAFATLSLGVVLGPEAPLIALGGGLGVLAVKLVKRDAPARTQAAVAAAGSFAAISTLLGSPLTGAFLLMEASGLGGAMLQVVLVPGLLAAGVGSLVFVGLNAWTGLGTFSLAIPGLPHVGAPTLGEFLWALGIGVLAVPFGLGIRWLGLFLRPHVERRMVLLTPVVGLAVAGLAIAFAAGTGKGSSEVLFSGQSALGPFVDHAASYSVGAVVLLLACKGIAYGISLSSFRGGPTFPALFLGAAGGVALSHLPGLPLVDGVAMGIAAMSVVMLRLPLTSVLLASLLLASDGLAVMPLVIVAVVVAYVLSARLTPSPAAGPAAEGPQPAADPTAAAVGPPSASPNPASPVPADSDGRPEFPASSPPR